MYEKWSKQIHAIKLAMQSWPQPQRCETTGSTRTREPSHGNEEIGEAQLHWKRKASRSVYSPSFPQWFVSIRAREDRSIDRGRVQNGKEIFYLFSTVERAQARKRTHNLYRRMRGLTWHVLGSLFRINSLPAVLLSITFAPFVRNKLQQLYFSTWHRWIHICEMFSSQATAERSKWFCSSKMPTDRQTASARC